MILCRQSNPHVGAAINMRKAVKAKHWKKQVHMFGPSSRIDTEFWIGEPRMKCTFALLTSFQIENSFLAVHAAYATSICKIFVCPVLPPFSIVMHLPGGTKLSAQLSQCKCVSSPVRPELFILLALYMHKSKLPKHK